MNHQAELSTTCNISSEVSSTWTTKRSSNRLAVAHAASNSRWTNSTNPRNARNAVGRGFLNRESKFSRRNLVAKSNEYKKMERAKGFEPSPPFRKFLQKPANWLILLRIPHLL